MMENLLAGLDQHSKFLSEEELKSELSVRGINVDKFLNESHTLINQYQKEARLVWMRVADDKKQRMETAQTSFVSWVGKGEQAIRTAWMEMLRNTTAPTAMAFRNKTDLTIDDMARILDDHQRLNLRNQIKLSPDEVK